MRFALTLAGAVAGLVALAGCNETNLANEGQELGAKADNAIDRVDDNVDAIGEDIENAADRADNAVADVANSVDRSIDRVERAADAAGDELSK